jgi:LmbE family N-acetylglucosaminyl deacetylase
VQRANVDLILAARGEVGFAGERLWEAGEIREGELHNACLNLGIRMFYFLVFTEGQLTRAPG